MKMYGRIQTRIPTVLLLLSLSAGVQTVDPCTQPAKQGSSYTFTQEVNSYNRFQWNLQPQNGQPDSLSTCEYTKYPNCVNKYSGYDGKVEELNSNRYKMTFTIGSVTRTVESTWWWGHVDPQTGSLTELGRCHLEVYYFESTPSCDPIELTGSPQDTVSWKCRISNVYPVPLCQFEYKKDGGDYDNIVSSNDITEGDPKSSGGTNTWNDPLYYSRDCNMNVPVSSLGPGKYKFKVTMYPTLAGTYNPTAVSLGTSTESSDLTLALPKTSLKDCPKGNYIKAGTNTATCQCEMTDPGTPLGRPQWVNSNEEPVGQTVSNVLNTVSTLHLIYNKNDPSPAYTCRGVSDIGNEDGTDYAPEFAYGPDEESQITISALTDDAQSNKITSFNKCDPSDMFVVYCDVLTTAVNPKPKVKLEPEGIATYDRDTKLNSVYRFKYKVNPNTGGNLILTCDMSNTVFPVFNVQKQGSITINVPPPDSPVLTVNTQAVAGGQIVSVFEGQTMNVECIVSGGYPSTSTVTINCLDGQHMGVSPGGSNTATKDIVGKREMNDKSCTCTADHESTCYHKSKSFKLNVIYGPDSIDMEVNDKSNTFVSCEPDTSFNVKCDIPSGSVNPVLPNVNLKAEGVASTITENKDRFNYRVVPKTGGILTLTCEASNTIHPTFNKEEKKSITVKTPPSPPSLKMNGKSDSPPIRVTEGDTVKVECDVNGGYPLNSKVTITCPNSDGQEGENKATLDLRVNKEMNGKSCTCTVDHETRCNNVQNDVSSQLNVQYSPTMTNYTIGSEKETLTVNAKDSVTLVCDANGNPRPVVSVSRQRLQTSLTLKDIPSGDYEIRSTVTKVMGCRDTDVYTCTADNHIGTTVQKNVSVFVRCVPELPLLDSNIKEFTHTNATDLLVSVDIVGYPEPTDYLLEKVGHDIRRKRAVVGKVNNVDYNVTYISKSDSEGTVVLTMSNLIDRDSGQYVLTILNGIGDGLEYSFNVTVVSASTAPEDDDVPIIIGIVVAVVVVAVVVVVVVLVVKKRKKPKANLDKKIIHNRDGEEEMIREEWNELYYDGSKPLPMRAKAASSVDYDPSLRDSNVVEIDNDIYGMDDGKGTGTVFAPPIMVNGAQRESYLEGVEIIDNDVYGMDQRVNSEYTDYNSIVPSITSATAVPKNLSVYSDKSNEIDNPYEELPENKAVPKVILKPTAKVDRGKKKPPPPAPPVIAAKPSAAGKGDVVNHNVSSPMDAEDDNVYSAVILKKEKPAGYQKPTVSDRWGGEEEYSSRAELPVIPDKNYDTDGKPEKSAKPEKPPKAVKPGKPEKPKVMSKTGKTQHNTNVKNGPSSVDDEEHCYSNQAMVLDEDEMNDDPQNIYYNEGPNLKNAGDSSKNQTSTYKNKDGLNYSFVEFKDNKNSNANSTQSSSSRRVKVVDENVRYSNIQFSKK